MGTNKKRKGKFSGSLKRQRLEDRRFVSSRSFRFCNFEAYTCVFWDVEDFQIPDGDYIESISQNIDSALTNKGYQKFGMVEFRAYGEKNKIWDDFILAGISVIPAGDKCLRLQR